MPHVSAAERRPQLIAAAVDLMAREGVAAGSTRAIAAELGVAQATVHYTFGTKADLYRAVLESLTVKLHDGVLEAVQRAAGLEEALRATADVFWEDLCDRPEYNLLWQELLTFALRQPDLRGVVHRFHAELAQTAADAFGDVAVRTGVTYAVPATELATFLMAGLDGVCMSLLLSGGEPSAATRRALDQVIAATLGLASGAVPARPTA
ncbi:TetR/AcrR family transcriptional regulator [Streptomyces sp. NPDC057638]|uniref:TetR/AcrR family transcriptional regulator n=1 Tax=Streptomyces sp. NPDC057638 TaxID=3346190 RepID=UPI0036C34C6A